MSQLPLGSLGAPTMPEAIAQGEAAMEATWKAADEAWLSAAGALITRMRPGRTFIAEDIVLWLADHGHTTRNAKAIGPVMKRAASDGLIEKTGGARPARTSHGSLKPEWRRCL